MFNFHKISYLGVFSFTKKIDRKVTKGYCYCWEIRFQQGVYRYGQICDSMLKPLSKISLLPDEIYSTLSMETKIFGVPMTKSSDVLTVFEHDKTLLQSRNEPVEEQTVVRDEFMDPETIQKNAVVLKDSFAQSIKDLANPERHRKAMLEIRKIPYRPEIRKPHKFLLKDCSQTLREKNMTDIAITYATRIVELDPRDDHAEINLARLYIDKNLLDQAEKHVKRAIFLQHSEEDGEIYTTALQYIRKRVEKERLLYGRRFSSR